MVKLENNSKISVNDIAVSYFIQGPENAPSIVFIHGFPLNKTMWNNQIEALSNNYRTIAYDLRGHGNTDNGNQKFTIDLFVSDLISFMDNLNIDKTILCGLSMGGYIALNAIQSHPQRFNALILSDTNCTADLPAAIRNRMITIEIIDDGTVGKYADESLKKLFAAESLTNNIGAIALVREMIVTTSKQSLSGSLHALAERKETCTRLHEIAVPVLILVGKEDIITPLQAAHFMHENIKGSLLKIIDHAGHLSNMENPEEFNLQLKQFISSLKSS